MSMWLLWAMQDPASLFHSAGWCKAMRGSWRVSCSSSSGPSPSWSWAWSELRNWSPSSARSRPAGACRPSSRRGPGVSCFLGRRRWSSSSSGCSLEGWPHRSCSGGRIGTRGSRAGVLEELEGCRGALALPSLQVHLMLRVFLVPEKKIVNLIWSSHFRKTYFAKVSLAKWLFRSLFSSSFSH